MKKKFKYNLKRHILNKLILKIHLNPFIHLTVNSTQTLHNLNFHPPKPKLDQYTLGVRKKHEFVKCVPRINESQYKF